MFSLVSRSSTFLFRPSRFLRRERLTSTCSDKFLASSVSLSSNFLIRPKRSWFRSTSCCGIERGRGFGLFTQRLLWCSFERNGGDLYLEVARAVRSRPLQFVTRSLVTQLHLPLLLVQLKVAVLGLNLLRRFQQLKKNGVQKVARLTPASERLRVDAASFLFTSMLRLYWLCRLTLPAECSDSRWGASECLMKELKDFKVVNTVVSSSKSMLWSPWSSEAQMGRFRDESSEINNAAQHSRVG